MTATAPSGWPTLTSTALIGTARRAVPDIALGIELRADARPEDRMLDLAALMDAARRAGRVADPCGDLPPAAPPDRYREPSGAQRELLAVTILQSPAGLRGRSALLAHWCGEAAAAGVHATGNLLPHLLELATADHALRAPLRKVLDARGYWLAALNPDWQWAKETTPAPAAGIADTEWVHLPTPARVVRVQELRRSDPAAGRELMESTWSSETAKDRGALLGALSTTVDSSDEELLERALDDRAAGVRDTAIRLLDRLPDSARAARMEQRLGALVRVSGRLRRTITVELPDDPDEAARRDGVDKVPAGRSKRGWWLQRIVASAPLDFWTRLTGDAPARALARIDEPDVLAGLTLAAVSQRDADWAEALLDRGWTANATDLLQVLPPDRRERLVLTLLGSADHARAVELLHAMPTFGPELSRRLIADARDAKSPVRWILLDQTTPAKLHPAARDELLQLLDRASLGDRERRAAADLVQLISVQQSISEAFR
ncbi:hypothetical protein GCM10009624_20440 [Gordonia sinesedis]